MIYSFFFFSDSFFAIAQCNASSIKRVEKHLLHEMKDAFFMSPLAHLLTMIKKYDRRLNCQENHFSKYEQGSLA